MYDNQQAAPVSAHRNLSTRLVATMLVAAICVGARAQSLQSTSVIRKIGGPNDKLELTTNTSRILTLDKNIPRVQVNNPELLAVTPLSATQVQVSAKKAGVTQVNLWDDEGKIHCVDVLIYGDARELEVALQTQFPHASIKVFRYSESLVLTGFVDRPDHVSPIMLLAQDYSPKVINNISVGGVQQILLKTRVLEISRTKLRRMSTDFSILGSNGGFFSTGVSGLLQQTSNSVGSVQSVVDSAGKAAEFGIVHDSNAFFGFIDWLQRNSLVKVLAEPNIAAVSGRPAQFNVGGEIPIVVPQSLGTASIEFKPFGTQIDFLPIVLGNGNIRLEVRPRISDIDETRSVVVQNFVIPALTVRQVDTAVEMKAGQTFALAGLVQERTKSEKRGLPYVQDMPILGVPFRKTEDQVEEIELLVVVTPEFVDPIDACEAPCGGPGMYTTSPSNCGLYCAGHMEVPTACNPTQGLHACGQDPCGHCNGAACNNGCNGNGQPMYMNGGQPMQAVPTPGATIPGGTGYDESTAIVAPTTVTDHPPSNSDAEMPPPSPQDITLPEGKSDSRPQPAEQPRPTGQPAPQQPTPPQPAAKDPAPGSGASYFPGGMPTNLYPATPANGPVESPISNGRPYTPPRQPVFMRNASRPNNPHQQQWQPTAPARENSLIGPVGYDIQQ